MNTTPEEIIGFWFSDRVRELWFSSTPEFDTELRNKYQAVWEKASTGGLDDWCEDPDGCLALIIILDQFPLNIFRGQAKSFQTQAKAIEVARQAIRKKLDRKLNKEKLAFLFMPFMHSEDLADQELSVKLCREHKLTNNIGFAEHHRGIIRTFGRFPHRNKILNRESSPEEKNYLASENAFKG